MKTAHTLEDLVDLYLNMKEMPKEGKAILDLGKRATIILHDDHWQFGLWFWAIGRQKFSYRLLSFGFFSLFVQSNNPNSRKGRRKNVQSCV